MTVEIASILHASFICSDLAASMRFYQDVLHLRPDDGRPDLGYPGAWLNCGDGQIHLLQLPNPDPVANRPAHGGRDRHVAFAVRSLDALIQSLNHHKLDFSVSKSGRKALFVRDPDGNALEFIEMQGANNYLSR